MTSALNSWFITLNPNPNASSRLFCFHYAGGNASLFYPWTKHLDASIELIAIQLPGHGAPFKGPLLASTNAVILYLKEAILPYFDRPCFFFGHSLGALIAFELARTLQRDHKLLPNCLFVSGSPPYPPEQKSIHHLSDQEFIEEIKKYSGTPPEILEDALLRDRFLPILRNDFKMLESHVYHNGPPLTCDLIALGGLDDPIVKAESIKGWKIHTSQKFQSYIFSGDHFFIKPQQQKVIEILHQTIQRALKESLTEDTNL